MRACFFVYKKLGLYGQATSSQYKPEKYRASQTENVSGDHLFIHSAQD